MNLTIQKNCLQMESEASTFLKIKNKEEDEEESGGGG